MMRNIILCGFMGCGKSTIGKLLAKQSGREYLDLDIMIEDETGKSIPEIFSENGEDVFRELEHNMVKSLEKRIGCVVSTGGGTLTYQRNIDVLSADDIVVFLDADFITCYERIRYSSRPLVREKSVEMLEELFNQRYTIYKDVANIRVPAGKSPLIVVRKILKIAQNSTPNQNFF